MRPGDLITINAKWTPSVGFYTSRQVFHVGNTCIGVLEAQHRDTYLVLTAGTAPGFSTQVALVVTRFGIGWVPTKYLKTVRKA